MTRNSWLAFEVAIYGVDFAAIQAPDLGVYLSACFVGPKVVPLLVINFVTVFFNEVL